MSHYKDELEKWDEERAKLYKKSKRKEVKTVKRPYGKTVKTAFWV